MRGQLIKMKAEQCCRLSTVNEADGSPASSQVANAKKVHSGMLKNVKLPRHFWASGSAPILLWTTSDSCPLLIASRKC